MGYLYDTWHVPWDQIKNYNQGKSIVDIKLLSTADISINIAYINSDSNGSILQIWYVP